MLRKQNYSRKILYLNIKTKYQYSVQDFILKLVGKF